MNLQRVLFIFYFGTKSLKKIDLPVFVDTDGCIYHQSKHEGPKKSIFSKIR